MWQHWLRNRAAIAISSTCRWRHSLEYHRRLDAVIAGAAARSLSSSASSLPHYVSAQWGVQQEAKIQLPRLGQTLRRNEVTLAQSSGIRSPLLNNLSQFRHHSSSSRKGGTDGKFKMPRMSDCQSMHEAIIAVHNNLDKASPRDMAAFWTVVPKLLNRQRGRSKQEPLVLQLSKIFTKTADRLGNYRPRDLVTTALAFAKIIKILERGRGRHARGSHAEFLHDIIVDRKDVIFQFIGEKTIPNLSKFDAREISNLAYACALADYVPKFENGSTLFHHLAERSTPMVGKFGPQGLSNTVWAYATSGVSHPLMFERMADHIVGLDHLGAFKPQALANTIWAFAKTEVSQPPLFERLANHIVGLDYLGEFDPQHLSNTLWAFSKAEVSHPPLFEKVADHIIRHDDLVKYKPQDLSNTIWAFAKAEVSHPLFFEKVANHIVGFNHLGAFNPQNLANTIWAYATSEISHPGLFDKIADHIASLDNLEEFKPQHHANIVWAFVKAEMSHPGLFDKIAHHIVSLDNLEAFNRQNIKNLIWGFAKAGVKNVELFDKLADVALDKEDEFTARDIANILRWTK